MTKDLFNQLAALITKRYGLSVHIGPITNPESNTGEFDGMSITVDEEEADDIAFYVLLHLFGHTVQWDTDPELRALGQAAPASNDVETLERIHRYEENASRIGLQALHEAGITDMDQWVSDWFAADWRFLEHFYTTGERLGFRDTFQPGAPLLLPMPVPSFTPHHWDARWSF